MNIAGLLVHAQPECAENVRVRLAELPGVEVHAASPDGQLVVTVEQEDDREMPQVFERLNAIPGVCATALVYHHCGSRADEALAQKESAP